ncbi:MAG: hypothetical protein KGD65_11170 [Candidatus Lokiarchaeota archaeon]|nr:hypothetical protein [Candidatus Lokiarchaeota archaeon]
MSIDKWLSEKGSKEEEQKREEAFKRLTESEVKELKKKKIRNITQKEDQKSSVDLGTEKFLRSIVEFKDWLNQRTYLKGDIEKIETWINILYSGIKNETEERQKLNIIHDKKKLVEDYKKIPPKFLDENTRIALNKKIYGTKRTNSDNYYLRKLKTSIQDKLNEAEYYEILERILKIF